MESSTHLNEADDLATLARYWRRRTLRDTIDCIKEHALIIILHISNYRNM